MSNVKVKESVHDQPDVSRIDPVHVPVNHTSSFPVKLVYTDEQDRYRHCIACWDGIDKCWRYQSNRTKVEYNEAIRTEPIEETKQHY